MIDEKVKIKCTKCSQVFRERAQNIRNGFQTNCQHCNRPITFDTTSEDRNIRRALMSAKEVRMALQIGAMRFAPHDDLIGQHLALGRGEGNWAVLALEGDRQAAGLEQTEHIGCGRGGQPPLVRNDVVLGAIAGRDVVFGDHRHQVGTAFDLVDLLGLALGDQGTGRMLCSNAF